MLAKPVQLECVCPVCGKGGAEFNRLFVIYSTGVPLLAEAVGAFGEGKPELEGLDTANEDLFRC